MQSDICDFVPRGVSIDEAIDMVKEDGYVVLPRSSLEYTGVTSARKLVDFFYNYLQYKNPHRKIHYSLSTTKDMVVAKRFISARKATGISHKRAANEAAHIVKCVIDNESLFGLTEPLSSFQIFMGGKMQWVIDKAISIINNENVAVQEEKLRRLYEDMDRAYEREQMSSVIESKNQELDALLEGLDNGEEKER